MVSERPLAAAPRTTVARPLWLRIGAIALVALSTLVASCSPESEQASIDRGTKLADESKYKEAVSEYDRAIAINPKSVAAYIDRGNAYDELGNSERALADYDSALAIDPQDAYAHRNRGATLNRLGRQSEALQEFDKAIALKPDYGAAYSSRADILRDRREYDVALVAYDKAIGLGGLGVYEAGAYEGRGFANYFLGRLDAAIADFTKTIALSPEAPRSYFARAVAYADKNDFDRALADLDTAAKVSRDPATEAALQGLRDYIAQKRR